MKEFIIADEPDQQFSTILEGRRVTIRIRYNPTIDRWSFDLSRDDLPILYGRRIVTGVDLLKPFNFGIGVIFADGGSPTRSALIDGTVRLFQTTEAEINEAIST